MAPLNSGVKIEIMCFRILLIIFSLSGGASASWYSGELPDLFTLHSLLAGKSLLKPEKGMFLVSSRSLNDAHFGQSIVYLIEHDTHGSVGLIVNRSTDVSLSEAVPEIDNPRAKFHTLYYGGPVGLPAILMLASIEQPLEGMTHIEDDVYISPDRNMLDKALEAETSTIELQFYLGYSGWAPGQLDMEIADGSWHVVKIDSSEIFSGEIESLWQRQIERLEPLGIQVKHSATGAVLARAGY